MSDDADPTHTPSSNTPEIPPVTASCLDSKPTGSVANSSLATILPSMPDRRSLSHLSIEAMEITVTRRKVKNLTIRVGSEGVSVTAPWTLSDSQIREMLLTRQQWIRNSIQKLPPTARFITGESFLLWGIERHLSVHKGKREVLLKTDGTIHLQAPAGASSSQLTRIVDRFLAAETARESSPLVDRWSRHLAVRPQLVRIRKMKSRWGSCVESRISLNSELARYDPRFLEYVVVHELAHILEPNHGPGFYRIMDEALPNWRELRKALTRASRSAPQSSSSS